MFPSCHFTLHLAQMSPVYHFPFSRLNILLQVFMKQTRNFMHSEVLETDFWQMWFADKCMKSVSVVPEVLLQPSTLAFSRFTDAQSHFIGLLRSPGPVRAPAAPHASDSQTVTYWRRAALHHAFWINTRWHSEKIRPPVPKYSLCAALRRAAVSSLAVTRVYDCRWKTASIIERIQIMNYAKKERRNLVIEMHNYSSCSSLKAAVLGGWIFPLFVSRWR